MSTPFYDLASLVVVPSGYKAAKIYAQKPLTTDGQLAFTRASTATRVNASGLIETVASGVPRLDYLGSTCPKLLLEPQRTNLVTFSEQFDNAAWSKEDISSVTANAIVSPDGSTNADLVIPNTTSTDHSIYQSATAAVSQTFSVFAKAGGYNFIFLGANNGVASDGVFFNLTNGTISQNTSVFTAKIESYGNGWYRCSISAASWPVTYAIICTSANGTSFVHAGNGTSGVYVWGAQLELGAYATSYIPTLGTSVTRVKDNCIKTGVSSLIGQTEGTVFVEFKINGQSINEDIYSNNKNLTGSISIQLGTNGQLQGYICFNGGFISLLSSTSAIQIGQTYKIALAYKTGNSALYINGVQVATNATAFAFTTTLSEIDIANDVTFFAHLNNKLISQVLQFKTRHTNSQLAELTAL